MKNRNWLKFSAAMLMAVAFGFLASGILSQVSFSGAMFFMAAIISPLLMAFLYGYGGIGPASVMALAMVAGGFSFAGAEWAAALMIGAVVPAFVMIYSSYKGYGFFVQLRSALIIQFLAYLTLLLCLYLMTGKDIASLIYEELKKSVDLLPFEAKEAFAEFFRMMLETNADADALQTTEGLINALLSDVETILPVTIPSALILYSFINGAFGVLWVNWLRYKHGEENNQFIPVSGWRLSKEITLGLLIFYILSIILGRTAGERAISAISMVATAVTCAAYVQAAASILSRFKAAGMSRTKRTWICIPILIIGSQFAMFYGIMSALFGSKGLFKPKMLPGNGNGKNDGNNNQNEEENEK